MYKQMLLTLWLLPFLISGCGVSTCACAAPVLGIYTDEKLNVTAVAEYMPAKYAGVQVGDVLLDVRPINPEPGFSSNPLPFTNRKAVKEIIYHSPPRTVLHVGYYYCCPGVGMPLILRVQRDNQVVEIEITSGFGELPEGESQEVSPIVTPTPMPTRTHIPLSWDYF